MWDTCTLIKVPALRYLDLSQNFSILWAESSEIVEVALFTKVTQQYFRHCLRNQILNFVYGQTSCYVQRKFCGLLFNGFDCLFNMSCYRKLICQCYTVYLTVKLELYGMMYLLLCFHMNFRNGLQWMMEWTQVYMPPDMNKMKSNKMWSLLVKSFLYECEI